MGFTKPIVHSNPTLKEGDNMNPLYVGIDVSSKSNVVYLMLPDGSKLSNFSVANSQDGSTQMVKRILTAITSHSLDTVTIGLEATSVYGDNLVYFLREDASLAPFNRKIHVLNPKQVKKFKEAYNDLPKNDYVDSFIIAACVSVESTKRFILEITAIRLSKTLQGHGFTLSKILYEKNSAF